MRMTAIGMCALLSLGSAASGRAGVRAASVFGDHMVLQRERPVPVWGAAAPGERVIVTFGGQQTAAQADPAGRWIVRLEAMPANAAPRELSIAGATNDVTFTNVLVGDVWLCSGQSNMDWPVRLSKDGAAEAAAANFPAIRAFKAGYASSDSQGYPIAPDAQRYALTPQDRCLGRWQVCTPETAGHWSGVAYFFARRLHRDLQIPIGLLTASYGASAIEAWTSVEGLKAVPAYRNRALAFERLAAAYLENTNRYQTALENEPVRLDAENQAWFARLDAEDPGLRLKWMASEFDTEPWAEIHLPVSEADNPLGSPTASIWFRKTVTIPESWVGQALDLHLGHLDAADEAYVNGARVGRTWFDAPRYWDLSRVYPVPAAEVTSPRVTIALRLLKTAYRMGIFGPAAEMKLTRKGEPGEDPVSLAGVWRMRKAYDLDPGLQPQAAPLMGKAPGHYYGHPGVMYNGLIHPLIPYALRGAIWYQGEANAPFYIDYRSLLPGLIHSWRQAWGQGDFAFGIVQLADFWGQQTRPVERGGYTPLREAQAMALSVTNTFLATAVGVGEGENIHPSNKQEVGRRLSLAALGAVYGKTDLLYYGPTYKAMSIEGSAIRLRFDFAKGLHAKGDPLVGFAIAGADRTFYFARAKIEGDTVVVSSDKVPHPIAVRYAWATHPVCNLYNAENLPAYPFHTDSWDQDQLVIPEDDTMTIPTGWVTK